MHPPPAGTHLRACFRFPPALYNGGRSGLPLPMFDPIQAISDFVRAPSVSTDPAFAAGMAGARDVLCKLFRDMGLTVEVCPTPLHPVVLARREGPAHWPHVVIYGHYDVQPADPLPLWTTPAFEPVIRDGRLYGRGTADNKGPQMAHIYAVAKLLEKNPGLPLRLTFLIEGEEEIGSPSLEAFLAANKERLKGDFVLLSDTMSPSADQLTITTGLRGILCLEAELTGPRTDLHSGIHGGALLNPIQALAELCASLHDADGRVNIPGYYDGVQPVLAWERAELAKLPTTREQYRKFLDISDFHTWGGMTPFEATRFQPTLEFNGIGGGYQGEGSKTVIPSKAFVKISCRLVPSMDPARIEALVVKTLKERCSPKVKIEVKCGHSGNAYRVVPPDRPDTPADQSPVLAAAFRAAEAEAVKVSGNPPIYLREGGSVPIIDTIRRTLGMDSVMLGLFTPECNLHAPDESLHLGLFAKGAAVSEAVLAAVAGMAPRTN